MKTNFLEFAKDILIEAFFQTLYMTTVATIFQMDLDQIKN